MSGSCLTCFIIMRTKIPVILIIRCQTNSFIFQSVSLSFKEKNAFLPQQLKVFQGILRENAHAHCTESVFEHILTNNILLEAIFSSSLNSPYLLVESQHLSKENLFKNKYRNKIKHLPDPAIQHMEILIKMGVSISWKMLILHIVL